MNMDVAPAEGQFDFVLNSDDDDDIRYDIRCKPNVHHWYWYFLP